MKLYTYKDFTDHTSSLTFETAGEVYSELVGLVEIAGPEIQAYWSDFLNASVDYAARRAHWLLLSRDKKVVTDDQRTAEHDTVIRTITVVRNFLDQQELPTDWYVHLIFNNVQARKRIGDFACYVAYIYGLNAR